MARDWEAWFTSAVRPASETEEEDRDRTERRIREAIAKDDRLASQVRVFTKGSYANFTNIRRDSDVDIAVEWKSWSYISKRGAAKDLSWAELGVSTAEDDEPPTTDAYRTWVEDALIDAFGSRCVDTSGSKHICVAGSSTTLDADVVPCFRHKLYVGAKVKPHKGIVIYPKGGGDRIENWPEQNRVNGSSKNTMTSRRYKKMVRAIKRLESDMVDVGELADPVHGYFVECLLYNVPHAVFVDRTYKQTALDLLERMHDTIENDRSNKWEEVNERKRLWYGGQTWTKEEASSFAETAWEYVKNG